MQSQAVTKNTAEQSEVYQAPAPQRRGRDLAGAIFSRLLFPPILVWDAFKYLFNYLAGEALGRKVLQAQTEDFAAYYDENFRERTLINIKKAGKVSGRYVKVKTHDGAELDTMELQAKRKDPLPLKEQTYVIHLLGNAQCYESLLDDMKEEAQTLDCNVIGFNFRNVGWSKKKPRSKADLVTDAIAQVQRLLDQGVPPEKITLKGFSLGASIATLTAKHFHDRGIKINLFNDRSFSSLTNVVVGHIRRADWDDWNGHRESLGKKILGYIAKPIVIFILALLKWEIDAASAFKTIPETHKEYMVARSSAKDRKAWGKGIRDDGIIMHYASLHAALKDERKAYKNAIDKKIKTLEGGEKKLNSYQVIDKNLKQIAQLKEERANLKRRKMVAAVQHYNAHNLAADDLSDRHQGHTGREFFVDFFKKAQLHHREDLAKKNMAVTVPPAAPAA